ncbi:porin [Neptunomonas sp.]|uniref:porin n=1 Tax=Neptunomonas sp. TaxID=1971898 RepID=UPI0035638711
MKLKTALISMAVVTCSVQPTIAQADGGPVLFGNLNAGIQKVQGETDLDGQAFEASIGVKGAYKKDDFLMLYKLEAEFTEAVNNEEGKSDLEIKNASIVFPTKYGVFVIEPRGESAHQRDLYGAVDIFENNEADNSTLWGQPDEGSSVFAYVTPAFNNIVVKAAVLTLNSEGTPNSNYNQNDVDVFDIRVLYENEGLRIGLGNSAASAKQTGANDTFNTTAFTLGYELGNTHLGLTWEHQGDHPAPFDSDTDVIGVVADVKLNDGWSVGMGYTDKDSEHDAWDDSATTVIVRKQILENVYAYAEGADYKENTVSDNFSIGINVSF